MPNQEQKLILDAVRTLRRVIFKKERQIGMSTVIRLFLMVEACLNHSLSIGVFTPNMSMAQHNIKRLLNNIPAGFVLRQSYNEIEFISGSIITAQVFKHHHLISKRFDIVFLDEFMWMEGDPIADVLPSTKKLIAASSSNNAFDFHLGNESLRILDTVDVEVFGSEKLSYVGVK